MKERLFIIISLVVVVGVLIALNAASFVRLEKENDRELVPNRSSLNAGATGTRAFYELLRETGKDVIRWQESPSALFTSSGKTVKTFVVIGELRQDFTETEATDLQNWVKAGGRLVIIDRNPDKKLLPTETAWKLSTYGNSLTFFDNPDPANVKEMTNNVKALAPLQPTGFTKDVEAVMPSRFATGIDLNFESWDPINAVEIATPTPKPVYSTNSNFSAPEDDEDYYDEPPPPTPRPKSTAASNSANRSSETDYETGSGQGSGPRPPPRVAGTPEIGMRGKIAPTPKEPRSILDQIFGESGEAKPTPTPAPRKYTYSAPVVHLSGNGKNILVDYPYGAGQVVLLSDPYIVANGGIRLVDNVKLLQNLTDNGGTIAFDEFHQGYGARGTRLFQYFANTPLVSIFWQLAALVALFVWSRGRRFARPLPLPNPDRRSKLEYVAAMAELQKRTKSYDLALETIYTRTRRNISRAVGVDNTTIKTSILAQIVAERIREDKIEIRRVFERCEDIIHGEKTNARKVLDLIEKLREIETKLGLRRN